MKLFTIEDLIFNKEDFLDDINEFVGFITYNRRIAK